MSALGVRGGTVLVSDRSSRSDVIVASGRIVSVLDGVGTTRTGRDEPARSIEGGTVGAGAERSAVDPPVLVDAEPAPGTQFSGAGGASGVDSPVRVDTVLDATGLVVAPGFIDLQCNGALGVDLTSDPDRLGDVAAGLPRWGVTAWLPTVVTSPPAVRLAALRALREHRDVESGAVGATPLGLHLEGPFLAPARRGAHDPDLLAAPALALVDAEGWSRAARVALVTLAPELPGALDVVRALVDRGVVVAAGHTSATATQARAGLDAGVTGVTHLFNAMGGLHHRAPGLAGVALTDPRPQVGLIADGVHVDPTVVALAARALGDRMVLVSDAVAALGVGHAGGAPARSLGSLPVDVPADGAGEAARLADGTLAGSVLSLDRALRNLMAFAGVDLAGAVRAVTAAPAALLGLPDRGVIAPGAVGDLVLLTPDGHVVATVVGGQVAYDTRGASVP
jgi:N-acetylglucosamine-6-phosphate deacetylase